MVFGVGGIDAPGCQAINYIFGLFQFFSKTCLRSQAITVSCARASQSLTTVEFVQCERDSLHVPDSRTAGDTASYTNILFTLVRPGYPESCFTSPLPNQSLNTYVVV